MAQSYKFYKIGEANAEIARLEARVTELEGVSGNETELAGQLKARDSKISELEKQIATHATAISDKDAKISSITAERDSLKAAKETAEAKAKETEKAVDVKATDRATDIIAATGLKAPLVSKPSENPTSTEPEKRDFKAEIKPLTGLQRLALERK